MVKQQAELAKAAARTLAALTPEEKRSALLAVADSIAGHTSEIMSANQKDVEQAGIHGLPAAVVDRLSLKGNRISAIAKGVMEIADLPDPVGEVIEEWSRKDGLKIKRVRVPIGVIGIIYEARPNVTADAAALCLKSGNAVILRGSTTATASNTALANVIIEALRKTAIPAGAVQFITPNSTVSGGSNTVNYSDVEELVRLKGLIDLIITRGSEEMIARVSEISTVPVLGHGKGVCHVYVDKSADIAMAENIAFNAKVQRPGVCNAMETLLVHRDIAAKFLPNIARRYKKAGVELRGDDLTRSILPWAKAAAESDWTEEYLDLILAIKVVDSVADAILHINKCGSGHTDTIVTEDEAAAKKFLNEIDSACVMHNASTRLHDGGQFGLGAEIGISTHRLHARGTMGVRELTTTKYIVIGAGHLRE